MRRTAGFLPPRARFGLPLTTDSPGKSSSRALAAIIHLRCSANPITKVTFTRVGADPTIQIVVWQFWGRAAEASWTEKSRALFSFPPDTDPWCLLLFNPCFHPPSGRSWTNFGIFRHASSDPAEGRKSRYEMFSF